MHKMSLFSAVYAFSIGCEFIFNRPHERRDRSSVVRILLVWEGEEYSFKSHKLE